MLQANAERQQQDYSRMTLCCSRPDKAKKVETVPAYHLHDERLMTSDDVNAGNGVMAL